MSTPDERTDLDRTRPQTGTDTASTREQPRGRPTVPSPSGTALTSRQHVLDHLVGLVGPQPAPAPTAWFTFLDEARRVVPVVVPVEGLPALPGASTVAEVVDVVSSVLLRTPEAHEVLVAISRPDGGDLCAFERRWANAIWTAGDQARWTVGMIAAVGSHRTRALDRSCCSMRL